MHQSQIINLKKTIVSCGPSVNVEMKLRIVLFSLLDLDGAGDLQVPA